MTPLNKEQRRALKRVYDRCDLTIGTAHRKDSVSGNKMTYREFRKTVQYGPGCVMVPWCGMWLGIEPDGYTHS